MNVNKLPNRYQSAYKSDHCSKTALLTIKIDIHLSLAYGEPIALIIFDLSKTKMVAAPFDMNVLHLDV